jgi:Tn3 transposase DDE domain
VKTNFILAWLADEELRGRIGRQLNKGEQLHALRRAIFYADEATSGIAPPEQQAEQALCLSIVVNAILAWNTVYTQRRARPAPSRWRADHDKRDRTHLAARPQAHPPPRPLPFNLAARPDGHRPLRTPINDARDPAPKTPNRV